MTRLFLCLTILLFPLNIIKPAQADYYFWQDPDTKLSVTFPDTWKKQNNRLPGDILTIAGPSSTNDRAQCVIRTKQDKRYTIYPPNYGDAIQRKAISTDFWRAYMGHYDDYVLNTVYDGGGLGRWRASYAFATYDNHNGTALEKRRALMFASLYNDTLYIVECSALNHAYDKWDSNFRSIIKSIDFKKAYHRLPQGDYANFLKEADLYFWAQTGHEGTTRY